MSNKLTDMQLVLLSAASQRDDHCLTLPTGVQRGSARKAAAKLLEAGLVKEVRARKDAPMWRRDEETEQPFALKLTAAGLMAIATEANEDSVQAAPTVDDAVSSQRPESFLIAKAITGTSWNGHRFFGLRSGRKSPARMTARADKAARSVAFRPPLERPIF